MTLRYQHTPLHSESRRTAKIPAPRPSQHLGVQLKNSFPEAQRSASESMMIANISLPSQNYEVANKSVLRAPRPLNAIPRADVFVLLDSVFQCSFSGGPLPMAIGHSPVEFPVMRGVRLSSALMRRLCRIVCYAEICAQVELTCRQSPENQSFGGWKDPIKPVHNHFNHTQLQTTYQASCPPLSRTI